MEIGDRIRVHGNTYIRKIFLPAMEEGTIVDIRPSSVLVDWDRMRPGLYECHGKCPSGHGCWVAKNIINDGYMEIYLSAADMINAFSVFMPGDYETETLSNNDDEEDDEDTGPNTIQTHEVTGELGVTEF